MSANSKETLLLVDALSNVKNLPKEVVFHATEQGIKEAIISILRKTHGTDLDITVSINRSTGDYIITRHWEVIEDDKVERSGLDIKLSEALTKDSDITVGDVCSELMESIEFGRITSRTAKQFIMKKIREAEIAQVVSSYRQRIGELLSGIVQRVTREFITVDLGNNVEAVFMRDDLLPREAVRAGDRLRGALYDVKTDGRSTQLLLSRTRPEMLIELFRIEVPEVAEQLIQIKAVARDPGVRAKIAVKTNDGRIDPIGACVGMRGSRVQSVSNELNSERIDIILWDDNPAQLVINAMAPAEVSSIVVDEDLHVIDIAVDESQLSLAIGKNGQNIRLASLLTGWKLNVMNKADANEKHQAETQQVIDEFIQELGVDQELGQILVEQGFTHIEEIAYVSDEELLAIDGFDQDIVEALKSRATEILLTKETEESYLVDDTALAEDLSTMDGMTDLLAKRMKAGGILTREDLADQGVMDLLDIIPDLEPKKAAELIMTARKPWFGE